MAWRKPGNMHEWMDLVVRHRKKAFFGALITMIAITIASIWLPRQYRATAKIQRKNDEVVNQTNQAMIRSALELSKARIRSDITERDTMVQLINELREQPQLSRKFRFPTQGNKLTAEGQLKLQDTVDELTRNIDIEFEISNPAQDIIAITFTHPDKELVHKVVNTIAETYISKVSQQLDERLLVAFRFFEQKVNQYKADVQEFEVAKIRFEQDKSGMQANDPTSVQSKLGELQDTQAKLVAEIDLANQRRKDLQEWHDSQSDFIQSKTNVENPEMKALPARLDQLQSVYDDNRLLGKKDEHPDQIKLMTFIAAQKVKIDATDPQITQNGDEVPNLQKLDVAKEIKTISGAIKAMEAQNVDLTREVDRFEELNREFFQNRAKLMTIESDLSEARESLTFWNDNLRRTNTALMVNGGRTGVELSILQVAQENRRASWPSLPTVLMAALIGGGGAALLMIILAELLDRSFHSVEQAVDDLKLPVLGAVNEIITPGVALRRKVMALGVIPSIACVMLLVLSFSVWAVWLNLSEPLQYDQFARSPLRYMVNMVTGGV